MEILLIIIWLIFACLVFLLYGYKIRQMRKEPRNKIRFFVEKEMPNSYFLYIANKNRSHYICSNDFFEEFGFNPDDFADMKEGEIREVFINLED